MKLLTFKGGVHPFEGKELSMNKAIEEILPGDEMVYFLSQHIGKPADPCVAKGDQVLRGQLIAAKSGFVSANIYSSVSGTVKAIDSRLNNVGDMAPCIVIANDGNYTEVEYESVKSFDELTKEIILQKVEAAGVVGAGGAGFPTSVKLAPKNPEAIEYVLVNAAECEPYLTCDYRSMLEKTEKLVKGLKCMLMLFPNAQGCIGVENNKPEAIAKLEAMVKDEPRISVKVLKTKYPQGGERTLIKAITGRELNVSMLPSDVGCIVDNVETVCNIYDAVFLGKPVMERTITVTGDAVADTRNFRAYIGTDMNILLEKCGGFKTQPEKVICGGPMMGFALFDTGIPVTKTTSGLLCLSKDAVAASSESACINCGRCVQGCPEFLLPTKLSEFARRGDEEKFVEFHGKECIECGSCSYVCPAKRSLAIDIKTMKKAVMRKR
ncbi:MAG: electron transport complex subunit RsxC [Lachnospiraceae bacterium]|jgi:electron transport complex protein RnfC